MKRIGLIGGAVAAIAAMAGIQTTNNTIATGQAQVSQESNSQPNNQQAPVQAQSAVIPVARRDGRRLFKPYAGPGISPKEYGMNYVRRGTHKRTNRR